MHTSYAATFILCFFLTAAAHRQPMVVRALVAPPPTGLNPRQTVDATGQRMGALWFSGLTRMSTELKPAPDLAKRWFFDPAKKTWTFEIDTSRLDHGGERITPERLVTCLENYRAGSPASAIASQLSHWTGTSVLRGNVVISLTRNDPFFPQQVALLRYFRTDGQLQPCLEPASTDAIIGSGPYRPTRTSLETLLSQETFRFDPIVEGPNAIELIFARDENTRALLLLQGKADVAYSTFNLSKTDWFRHHPPFGVVEQDGVNVSYLAFNTKRGPLQHAAVRRALASALDRDSYVKHRLFEFCTTAESFIHPALGFGTETKRVKYDPAMAERALDAAGWPRDSKGQRFELEYLSTPQIVGREQALFVQHEFKKIGVTVTLRIRETGVFFSALQSGAFDLHTSRWIGVSDPSILRIAYGTREKRNRTFFSNTEIDRQITSMLEEHDPARRRILFEAIETKLAEEQAYVPLWFWNNAMVIDQSRWSIAASDISRSSAFESLALLMRKQP